MLDPTKPKDRIISAALKLAAERAWEDVSLLDVATAAGLTLADLRREFSSKGDIQAGVSRMIDDEVLAKAKPPAEGTQPRDALFEVIMARFDAMQPYKDAIRSMHKSGWAEPELLGALVASQRWMLDAAGVPSDGARGIVRTAGVASVYGRVFRIWLEDDDPGLARTMAALDRRLRGGERAMGMVDDVGGLCSRLVGMLRGAGRPRRHPAGTNGAAAETPAG